MSTKPYYQPMSIIAFTGSMGSGKSTAIERITELHQGSVALVKFAEPLYDMQEMIYRRIAPVYKRPEDFKKDRKLLQWLGSEWGRDTIDKNLWVELWAARAYEITRFSKATIIVCDDVRFDNEAETIKSLGGKLIKLNCDKTDLRINTAAGIANHQSEAGINPSLVDFVIDNNGSLRDFRESITRIYQELNPGKVTKQK